MTGRHAAAASPAAVASPAMPPPEEERGTARVPYVDPPTSGAPDPDGLRALYAEIAAARGSVLGLHRALAGAPGALRAYFRLSHYIRDESSLDPRLRELAIVATGHALGVVYELAHHVPAARRAGLTEGQLAAVPRWRTDPAGAFGAVERAVLAYADEVARTRTAAPETLAALQDQLLPAQLIDLVLTVAFYHMVAAVVLPLGIEPETLSPAATAGRTRARRPSDT